MMEAALFLIAAALIAVGLCGAVVPALPGIPLLFCGIWLAAWADAYRHLGWGWLVAIALVGAIGMVLDLVSGALGAKRVGASSRAVWGALLGTLVGSILRAAGPIARSVPRRGRRRTIRQQQRRTRGSRGRQCVDWIFAGHRGQTRCLRVDGGAGRRGLVVEPRLSSSPRT
jgi:hypothetical protein